MAQIRATVVKKGPMCLVVATVALAYYQLFAAVAPAVPDLTPDLPDAITYVLAGAAIVTMLATDWRRALPLCVCVVVLAVPTYVVVAKLLPALPMPGVSDTLVYIAAAAAVAIAVLVTVRFGWKRAVAGAGALIGVLLLFGTAVYAFSAWLGERYAKSTDPVTRNDLIVGLAGGILLALVALTSAAFAGWWVYARHRRFRRIGAGVAVFLLAALGIMTAREAPGELDLGAKARGHGSFDVLLVVDPHDPAGRDLLFQAKDARLAAALKRSRDYRPEFDVAFGVAVLRRLEAGADAPPYETVVQPTTERNAVVAAVANVEAAPAPPAYAAYGRVFSDAHRVFGATEAGGLETGVRWRPGTRRAVVYFSARPPDKRDMDAAPASVAFTSALADHKRTLDLNVDSTAITGQPVETLSIYMVSADAASARAASWREWTADTGGRLVDSAAWGPEPLLHAAEDALTDTPTETAVTLAETYRPQLKFDSADGRRPVDVDHVLRARVEPTQVCDHTPGKDACEDVAGARSLLGERDEYIDFPGDARHAKGARGPARMYFHIRRADDRLHIGYWWYFTVNDAPVEPKRSCLPGLTISDLTCYDHEGDWEGVTVTLAPRARKRPTPSDPYDPAGYASDAWRPESVSYDAHGDPVRWEWWRLAQGISVVDRTHPVVYVAKGSHASYPLPCGTRRCKQDLAVRRGLPDGDHDGEGEWTKCGADCLIAMPSVRRPVSLADQLAGEVPEEDPVLWNAFQGRWGAAHCLPVGRVCNQSDGPLSPSRQHRYANPADPVEPSNGAKTQYGNIVDRLRRKGVR